MKIIKIHISKYLLVTSFLVLYTVSFGYVSDTRKVEILNQVNTVKCSDWNIDLIADKITKDLHTDEEKVIAIYLWMVRNIKYDHALAVCEECSEHREDYDTYKIVYNKRKGVCSGLSNLFKYLVSQKGITAYVVGGTATTINDRTGSHAWNIVKINNKWNYVDMTWALGVKGAATPWLIKDRAAFKRHKERYLYVSYSSVDDKEIYEGMDYLKSFVYLYESYMLKYIKSNMSSCEIAKATAVKGYAPSDAGILEAKFIVEIRPEYDEITNTVETQEDPTMESKKNYVPDILAMSDHEYRRLDKADFELLKKHREVLRNYVVKKEGRSKRYYKIDTPIKSSFWKGVSKLRGLHKKGKI